MAPRRRAAAGVVALTAALCLAAAAGGALAKPRRGAVAWKEDVPFIRCAVCEELAKSLHRQVKRRRDEAAPRKLTEFQIIELTEKICNPSRDEGEWITMLDIVQEGDQLKLVQQDTAGNCNSECKTIQRACEEVMGEHDTDVAELLYADGNRSALSKLLCKDLSGACKGPVPRVSKGRTRNEEFSKMEAKEAEMERLMRSMGDMPGAPKMKMYSRDDLMNGGLDAMGGASDDDDEEDEDDDRSRPPITIKQQTQSPAAHSQSASDGAKAGGTTPATGFVEQVQEHAQQLKSRLMAGGQQLLDSAREGASVAAQYISSLWPSSSMTCDKATQASRVLSARPDRCTSWAMATPSSTLLATWHATKPTPAFKT
eukprot:SM000019S05132  [mRNA]  locus=s19:1084624:1088069:- [translate_table: standard]